MSETATAARPYARAVFELANQGGDVAQWSEFLGRLAALARMEEARRLIAQPGVDKDQVADILAEAAKAEGDAERNFVRLLAHNRRLLLLPTIADIFGGLRREQEAIADVTLTTAVEISEEQRQALANAIERHLGRKADIHWEIDESLIAGARIRAGDQVIDASAAAALEQLRDFVIA
jgi:F-type H+-transporting ATPase subunit delta